MQRKRNFLKGLQVTELISGAKRHTMKLRLGPKKFRDKKRATDFLELQNNLRPF